MAHVRLRGGEAFLLTVQKVGVAMGGASVVTFRKSRVHTQGVMLDMILVSPVCVKVILKLR